MDKFRFSPILRTTRDMIKLCYIIYKISIIAFSFIFVLMIIVRIISNRLITWDEWVIFMICIVMVVDVFYKIDWKDGND